MQTPDIAHLDASDPLASLKDRFHMPDGIVYLDGNSLGLAPKSAFSQIRTVVEQEWAQGLIGSWNTAGWFEQPKELGNRLGRLLGAAADQTVICDTTSINIFKACHAALGLRKDRRVIVSELDSFPTDLYILEGLGAGKDYELRLLGRDGDSLDALIDDRVALVLLSHVNYRTGKLFNMREITALTHAAGGLVVWDLCHSAGVVPIALDDDEVDFAVGCTYKYLNCGPGAPAYVYAATRHLAQASQPLSGWWGHARPFAFEPAFAPHPGIEKFLCGTQPIVSMGGVKAGLGSYDGVNMKDARRKSLNLTGLFIELCRPLCAEHGLVLQTPRDDARGSQVSFFFAHGFEVIKAMISQGVVGDFRDPGLMRFGFSPLYTSFADVAKAAEVMKNCLETKVWEQPKYQQRASVT